MATDEDFMNVTVPKESPHMELGGGEPEIDLTIATSPPPNTPKNQIIERKLWTMTIFRVYPNGSIFITKTQSWFDKNQPIVKKKVKKKLKIQKAELGKEEVY